MEGKKLEKYLDKEIGQVVGVDTGKIIIGIEKEEILGLIKLNDIVIFDGNNADEKLIGIITKISKKRVYDNEEPVETDVYSNDELPYSENMAMATLVGTFYQKFEEKVDLFKRAINVYPEINGSVYYASQEALDIIMNSVSNHESDGEKLVIGEFASNKRVKAIMDGNRFFQKHAAIVGSTGSGKSYTVANILEKIKELEYGNAIVFDLHGEYRELSYAKHIKVGATDIKIPLWFFNYEEIHAMFVESSEGTSANQRATVIEYILSEKKNYVSTNAEEYKSSIITADTPIPFSVQGLIEHLNKKNTEQIETGEKYKSGSKEGENKTVQGASYGKLTNLINRLTTKLDDKKYSFVFNDEDVTKVDYLYEFMHKIMDNSETRIKVIDLSEVPSDILPIIIGITTRLVYDVQFWMTPETDEMRHPLTLVCDEAHIYMPNDMSKIKAIDRKSLEIFEKIAKEGRKYGLSLVVVSQRPSELNSTIISQCNNIISLKITNDRDKKAVSNMLTDSLAGLVEALSNLDVGECIVVGDAIMLPSKVLLSKPKEEPLSMTVPFWDKWTDNKKTVFDIDKSIKNMIKQSR